MNDPGRTINLDLTERDLAQISIALAFYGTALAASDHGLLLQVADEFRASGLARAEVFDVRDLLHKIERVVCAPRPPPGRA